MPSISEVIQLPNGDFSIEYSDGTSVVKSVNNLLTELEYKSVKGAGYGTIAGFGAFSGNRSTASNVTIQNKIQAPAPFCGLRLVYRNHSNANITMNWSRVATSTNAGGTGSALTWTNVTFSGSTSPIVLPAYQGSLFDEIWTFVVSDYIPLIPADSNNYVFVRSHFPGAAAASRAGSTTAITEWRTAAGLHFGADTASGDVLNTAGVNGASDDIAPHAVIFTYQQPAVAVTSFGGSHLRGNVSSGDAWGFIYRACAAKTQELQGTPEARVYSYSVNARGGQGNVAASQNAEKFYAAGLRADVGVILGYSGNDSDYSVGGFITAKGYFSRLLDALRKNNTKPIVCTAPPGLNVYTGAGDEGRRQEVNSWIRNLQYHNIQIVDLDAVYRNPNNPAQLNPLFDNGDGVHANDAGQALSALLLKEALP